MGSNHRKRCIRTALYGGNLRLLWGLPFDSRGISSFKGKNPPAMILGVGPIIRIKML